MSVKPWQEWTTYLHKESSGAAHLSEWWVECICFILFNPLYDEGKGLDRIREHVAVTPDLDTHQQPTGMQGAKWAYLLTLTEPEVREYLQTEIAIANVKGA